jgi:hypothetical protein
MKMRASRILCLYLTGLLGVAFVSGRATAAPEEDVEILQVGVRLPVLSGDYLSGRKAVLPDAAKDKVALLALGFTYESRHAVEAWTGRFRKDFGKEAAATFYEIPMIGGAGRLGRWFIDRGMRKGTPKELHENVITVYGGTGPWKRRLNFKDPDAAYLVLLDRTGTVRWLHTGKFDESVFGDLGSTARRVFDEQP